MCGQLAKQFRNDPRPLHTGWDRESTGYVIVRWGVFFYWSDWGLGVAWGLMGVTWAVTGCALWCLRTPARGDGGSVAPA